MRNINYQPSLEFIFPVRRGCREFEQWRKMLDRIDEILLESRIQAEFVRLYIDEYVRNMEQRARLQGKHPRKLTARDINKIRKLAVRALRCTLARYFTGESLRDFSVRLADSVQLQKFCGYATLDVVRLPGKSTLQRFEKSVPESVVRKVVDHLNGKACDPREASAKVWLKDPIDIDEVFVDTTCVKANIHFPVDWVLLRDAARTLIRATVTIRRRGLKHRMGEPFDFVRRMNRLAIEMTHRSAKNPESKKTRKDILQRMKELAKVIREHAKRHRDLLERYFSETDLSEKQARRIILRIDGVLKKLPRAIKQAEDRIIHDRKVPDKEKILSLYEEDAHVVVRGKAGARVEFGNTLLLVEQRNGVILDWQLFKDQAPADCKLVPDIVKRLEDQFGKGGVGAVVGDRGFDSHANAKELAEAKIYNAICPRDVGAYKERCREFRFRRLQKRRSQTEGRIGILKNCFLGDPMRSKGFAHRQLQTTWGVLAHNLWVLARLPQSESRAAAVKGAA